MNRIERRFKREIGKNIESFDAWAEKHREELAAVGVPERAAEAVPAEATAALVPATAAGPAVRQKRPFMKWVYSGAAVCLAVLCVILAIAFYPPREENYVYSDAEVKTGEVTEAEIAALTEVFPIIEDLSDLKYTGVRLIKDNSLIFINISGILETDADLYVITINDHIDHHYNYTGNDVYNDFTGQYQCTRFTANYKTSESTIEGLNRFLILVNSNDNEFYLEVSCFNDNLDELFELMSK